MINYYYYYYYYDYYCCGCCRFRRQTLNIVVHYDFDLILVNVPPATDLFADDMDRPICRDVERSSLMSLPVRLVVRMITASSNDDSSPELARFDGRFLVRAVDVGLPARAAADSSGSLLVALTVPCLVDDGALGGRPRSS